MKRDLMSPHDTQPQPFLSSAYYVVSNSVAKAFWNGFNSRISVTRAASQGRLHNTR